MSANKYLVSSLIEDLTDHITENCSKIPNVCVIYDQLLKLAISDSLTNDVKRRIATNFSAACASDSFKQIDEETLVSILKFNMLNIWELELLKACMRWTDSEVARRGLDANQANKRRIFEPIKHLIRFSDLSSDDLSSLSEIKSFLTMEEIGHIFFHAHFQSEPVQIVCTSPRAPYKARTAKGVRSGRSPDVYNDVIELSFFISVDRTVKLHSIKTFEVFNCSRLKVDLYVEDELVFSCEKLVATQGEHFSNSYVIGIDLDIDFPVVLKTNARCELRFSFSLKDEDYNFYLADTSSEMSLRCDDGRVLFKIESDSGVHCIDSIDFYGPFD